MQMWGIIKCVRRGEDRSDFLHFYIVTATEQNTEDMHQNVFYFAVIFFIFGLWKDAFIYLFIHACWHSDASP